MCFSLEQVARVGSPGYPFKPLPSCDFRPRGSTQEGNLHVYEMYGLPSDGVRYPCEGEDPGGAVALARGPKPGLPRPRLHHDDRLCDGEFPEQLSGRCLQSLARIANPYSPVKYRDAFRAGIEDGQCFVKRSITPASSEVEFAGSVADRFSPTYLVHVP